MGEGRGVPLCALWDCESRCVWGEGRGVTLCALWDCESRCVCVWGGGGFHCVHCTPQVEL